MWVNFHLNFYVSSPLNQHISLVHMQWNPPLTTEVRSSLINWYLVLISWKYEPPILSYNITAITWSYHPHQTPSCWTSPWEYGILSWTGGAVEIQILENLSPQMGRKYTPYPPEKDEYLTINKKNVGYKRWWYNRRLCKGSQYMRNAYNNTPRVAQDSYWEKKKWHLAPKITTQPGHPPTLGLKPPVKK